MNVLDLKLHKDIGLKLDETVYFGRKNVENIIKQHPFLFEDIDALSIDNSQMKYGFNKTGNPVKMGFEANMLKRIVISTMPINQKRFVANVSYDGHRYSGFQIQKSHLTIQGELSRIISNVNDTETLVQGASRTDAGVHALDYVFHFDTDKDLSADRWFSYLKHQLPDDISIKSIKERHPLFHSRYDVYKKRYIYKIRLGEKNPFRINYEWAIDNLDIEVLKENLKQINGTHDFTSFCKGNPESKMRTIYHTEMINQGNELILVFEGNGFLRYMIRIIVYALVSISQKSLDSSISELLKEKSRTNTKKLAPACGLYLEKITY